MQNGTLGKYEIRGILGKGAMGTVYDGYDAIIDRRVAIKTMTKPDPNDAEAQDELARFRREAQAAGRLAHPNIVGVYDYGEEGETAYIVMEYAPGTELKKLLDKGDRLPPAEAVRIMQGVLAGLQYSHERGVVHRDIKPGNIILSPDGTVKIADFGIARIESSSMTQAGTVLGTPAYMSPEQFMGQTVDARTDIYSAGVMFYQLLTGERPFEGSMSAIMHKALNTEPPRPSDISVTAPTALDMVVARAMAKRPENRFETAAQFAEAIRTALASPPPAQVDPLAGDDATLIAAPPKRPAVAPPAAPAAPIAQPPAAKSRAGLYAGIAAAILAVAGIGGYFAFTGSKQTPSVAPPSPVAPAPPVTPKPTAPTPTPIPPPPMKQPTPEQIRDSLAVALRNADCSLTRTTIQNGQVQVSGIVSRGSDDALRTIAHSALPPGAPDDSYTLHLANFSGKQYCGMLDLLRNAAVQPLDLTLRNGITDLHKDDPIVPHVTMPNYPAWLIVDYLQSNGSISHLHPSAASKAKLEAAGSEVALGDTKDGLWAADEPYGTDMVVSIASAAPLFTPPRPENDTARSYLAALTRALQAAQSKNIQVSAGALLVTTKPK